MEEANARDDTLHPAQERIVVIDILRGFALFGVLVANVLVFSYPFQFYEPLSFPGFDAAGRTTEWLVRVLVVGSFYPLFSFLFGVGFALYLRKGDDALPLFQRRLIVLLLIGFTHAIFIWSGDVLVTYALVGFLLIPFRKQSDVTLLLWMVGLTALTFALVWFLDSFGGSFSFSYIAQVTHAYGQGSYLEVTQQRLADTGLAFLNLFVTGPQILAFLLGGLLLGRQRRLDNIAQHRLFWKRARLLSFLVGVPIVGVHTVLLLQSQTLPNVVSALDLTLGSPALGFSYLASLFLGLTLKVQSRLEPLAAVGRMALTNYLAQSFIFTLIFYGYGGGLYVKVSPVRSILLAFVIFAFQVLLSRWWLKHFRYGPAEWEWRCLTYGRWFGLRR